MHFSSHHTHTHQHHYKRLQSPQFETINMKFSIVATALLAQGIAAMPWSSHKANGEEITCVPPSSNLNAYTVYPFANRPQTNS
jgi:tryptophan-rich sensory protein